MDVLDGILQGHDVDRARRVEFVEQRRQRRRLAGAGGAGDEDEPVLLVGHLPERLGKLQLVERRDLRLELPEDDREVAPLREDVDAEARLPREPVRAVARPLLDEELAEPPVAVDEVEREDFRLERGQAFDRGVDRHADQLARGLDLQRPVHRHVHVGHVAVRVQHRRQDVVDFSFAHVSSSS